MGFAWDFLIILKSASRSGQKASKTIGYSDGCANVRIHGAKQGTAGAWYPDCCTHAQKQWEIKSSADALGHQQNPRNNIFDGPCNKKRCHAPTAPGAGALATGCHLLPRWQHAFSERRLRGTLWVVEKAHSAPHKSK